MIRRLTKLPTAILNYLDQRREIRALIRADMITGGYAIFPKWNKKKRDYDQGSVIMPCVPTAEVKFTPGQENADGVHTFGIQMPRDCGTQYQWEYDVSAFEKLFKDR